MQTITQKKKLSKGTWALIILLFAALIAVAVAAYLGYIDLTFLQEALVSYAMFGTNTWINAFLIILAPFLLGVIVAIVMYRYFIGQKVTVATGAGVYTPQTGASASQNSGTSTEIS